MSEHKRFDINEMARLLEARKMNNHPAVLLLGARAGGLFRSDHFYDSLHQFSNRDFYKLSRVEQFGECYAILTKYLFSEIDIHTILSASLKNVTVTVADTCLVKLVGQGYFDEIISVNIDGMLEDTFKHAEMKEQLEFEVCLAGRDTPRYKKSSPCRIIKTFGDLTSRIYAIKGRLSHLDSYQELKSVLQRILARDLLVVGIDPIWDEEILRVIPREGGKLWFVNEDGKLTEHSLISAVLRARQAEFIVGREGSYDHFVRVLHGCLYGGALISYQLILDMSNQVADLSNQVADLSSHLQAFLAQKDTSPTHKEQPSMQDHTISNNVSVQLADVLIITVTEIETRSVLDIVKEILGIKPKRTSIGGKIYYNLGVINDACIFLVQSEMGIGGPGGSLLTVHQGIQVLKPSSVLMVGIAGGFDPRRQHIGDVLVSQQVCGYMLQRYGSRPDGEPNVVHRGDRVSASTRLLDKFKSACTEWEKKSVKFGLILSGDVLVDNKEFRDQLRRREPEAIGLDMEGWGLYSAAQYHKVDWLLVKAISDFADGNKSRNKIRRQEEAARNAALFTMHVLQTISFAASSPDSPGM